MNKTKFSTYNELLFQNNKLGIYNYYTKKFLIFEKNNDLIDFFMGYKYNTFIKQNQDLFSLLFCHGFIIDNKRDECSELLKKRVNFIQNDSIIALLVAPTMRCNLQCIYCFQHMKNMIHEKDISDALLSFIKTKQIQLIDVRWFGGEPTLKLDYIISLSKKMRLYAASYDIIYQAEMTTNGILLKDVDVSFLEETQITRFQISIDGYDEYLFHERLYYNGKDANIDILDGLKNLIQLGAKEVIARINISKINVHIVPQLLRCLSKDNILRRAIFAFDLMMPYGGITESDVFSEYEFSYIQFNLVKYAHSLGLNTTALFPQQIKYVHCLAETSYYYSLAPDGAVYKCDFDLSNNTNKIGTLFDYKNIAYPQSRILKTKCLYCKLLPLCFGGCMKENTCPVFTYTIKDRLKYIIFNEVNNNE